jgi:hypothetical protein
MSGCFTLTGLPEGLSVLTALQTLDLSFFWEGLTELPEGLSAMTALQTLNLERVLRADSAAGGALGADGAADAESE